ncbi:hypothetical protein EYC80_002601 [Monilinia laxa]|uniref:Uncharacterized protein n=1 Tax=Monilinia laxa TaxID=61186 RepID=A0A5N6K4H0_MONLA|nr:hypothetical protein EYC80_002601 [Monilinia laxa]
MYADVSRSYEEMLEAHRLMMVDASKHQTSSLLINTRTTIIFNSDHSLKHNHVLYTHNSLKLGTKARSILALQETNIHYIPTFETRQQRKSSYTN